MTAGSARTTTGPARTTTTGPARMTTGFVGLGQMGAPMAKHLVKRGLVVYDTRPEAVAPLVAEGARAAASVAELAAASDLVSVMVRNDAQVNEVAAEALPAMRPGSVFAIHSTIRARTAEDLAARADPDEVQVVDAPVSGGFMGAADGTLAVMVGGSEEAFERCREPFGEWAELVLHMGPVGAGTRTKLARNLLHFTAFTAAAEAQRLAEASGVSLRKLARIVRHTDAITGGAGSIMLRPTTAPLADDDPLRPILDHVRTLGEKDLAFALELADELGVDTPLARLALDRFASGLGLSPAPEQEEERDG
ncbi:NAD(P)-dependent oxidoreductase [Actinomadura gamaensis]|uniref:NAD(P)-dependent oxidoreductase n=1 Tax=Actinomadura gamaensis TaxID=1763541 RepID=A0ABV9TQ33_9ACTN